MADSDPITEETKTNSTTNVAQTATNQTNSQAVSSKSKLTLAELEKQSKYDLKLIAGGLCDLGMLPEFNQEWVKLKHPKIQLRDPLVKLVDLDTLEKAVENYLTRKI